VTFKAVSQNNYSNAAEKGNTSTNPSSQEQDSNQSKFLHSGVQNVGMKQDALYWHCMNEQPYGALSIFWLQWKTTTVSQGYSREKKIFSPSRGAGIFERVVLRFCF